MHVDRTERALSPRERQETEDLLPALARQVARSRGDVSAAGLAERYRGFLAASIVAGLGRESAELRAAVGIAGGVCFSPSAETDAPLEPCLIAFATMARFVEENGGGPEELVDLFLPRLPFDVVLDAEGRTAGDLILRRYGDALPEAATRAILALVEAEDTACRIHRTRSGLDIEDLRTGVRLPAPDGGKVRAPGMTCRLVRYLGRHVPLEPSPIDDPEDPWMLEELEESASAAETLVRELGITLRSRWKGVVMGGEVLERMMNDESAAGPGEDLPDFRNAEGHELVFTTLRWDVTREAGARERLGKVVGLELEETPEGLVGTLLEVRPPKAGKRPGESLTAGTVKLADGVLTIETSSAERAKRFRRKGDTALGRTATFRSVTSEPLGEAMRRPVDPVEAARHEAEQERLMALPEVREALARMARDHTLAWCDRVIPSLGNRRPRSLVRTEKGRLKVEALLAEFESHQAANPENPSPMDLDRVRREPGLDREA